MTTLHAVLANATNHREGAGPDECNGPPFNYMLSCALNQLSFDT